jgi:hypothetical protein
MKNKRIKLCDWVGGRSTDKIDINWSKIRQIVGSAKIDWLLEQPHTKCQLVVDKLNEDLSLVAEFYDDATLVLYHLTWAK